MIYYTASFVRADSIVALFAATLSSSAQNAVVGIPKGFPKCGKGGKPASCFHAFHTLSFPWPVLPGDQVNHLHHLAQYTAPATTAYRDQVVNECIGDFASTDRGKASSGLRYVVPSGRT